MVLGHEGAGLVEAVAPGVTHVAPGDRVAFCFVPSCGRCPQCRAGRTTLCEIVAVNMARGTLMDGTSRLHDPAGDTLQHGLMVACFAERCVIDAASAVPIPDGLPMWQAALLGCAVVTGVGAVRNVARVRDRRDRLRHRVRRRRPAGHRGTRAVRRLADHRRRSRRRRSSSSHVRAARPTGVLSGPDAAREVRRLSGGAGVDHAFEVVGIGARRSGSPGTRCVPAARPSSSDSRHAASRSACRRSSSSPTRACAAASTARATSPPSCRGWPSSHSRVASTWPARSRDWRRSASVQEALDRLRRGEGVRTVLVLDENLAGVQVSEAA